MWQIVRLGDLYDVGSSKRVLKADWKTRGIPFYRGREITALSNNGYVENDLFITEKHYQNLLEKSGVPNIGDIMITAIGTIGNTYIVQPHDKFYFKDASVLWLRKKADVSSQYVQYWLKTHAFFSQLDKGNGATVDTLTIKKLASVKLQIPPLAEQQRIVAKLDAAFAEIDRAFELNEKRTKEVKNLISKSQNQLFLSISETASVMRLGDVAKFENGDRGKNYPSKKYQIDEGIPFVNAGDFSIDGDIETQSMVYISEERFNLLGAGKFKIDDVLFCLRGSLGKSAINKSIEIGAIASSLVILRAKQNIVSSDYLFAYIRSDIVKNLIAQTAGGTAQPNLSAKVVSNYEIPVPSFEEQQRLTEKFWLIREKGLVALNRISQKSQQLFQLKAAILEKEIEPKESEAV